MKNADVILLLQEKLPKGHLVDWYETMGMVLETLPGEPEFDIVDEEFIVTTGNFAASFKSVSDGIEIQTLTSFGDKPSGYRITVPNDLKLVKALEALYNKAHAPEYKPSEVSSLDRFYFASGARTMRRRRTAAPTRSPEELIDRIELVLDAEQENYDQDLEGLSSEDYFADVKFFTGPEAASITGQDEVPVGMVIMTYDGAGYDFLSYQGEMVRMGSEELRVKIKNAAAEMGYMAEDYHTWSMGFYPDEGAQVQDIPKSETPQWLRDELEEEFGPFGTQASANKLFDKEALRLGSVLKKRFADKFSTEPREFESRAKDIMYDMLEEATVPWEQVSLTELAETAALELGHDEWLDDPDHLVWDWALEVTDN